MDSRITRDTRKFELRDDRGNVIETDLMILAAKDRQNVLWHSVKTGIYVVGSQERIR